MRNPRHLKLHTEEAERFVSDVKERIFRHDGHRLLQQHVRNARRRPNKFGVGLGKSNRESPRKIDGAVCAVGARLMWRQWQMVKPKPRTGEAAFF
jgi:phage terminase large subunit-like protein